RTDERLRGVASAGAGTRRECDPNGPCWLGPGVNLEWQPALDPTFAKRQRLVIRGTVRLPQPFRRVSQPGAGFRPRLPARSGPEWSAVWVWGSPPPKSSGSFPGSPAGWAWRPLLGGLR